MLLPLILACSTSPRTCAGSAALCDRPYDQVAQVATHNAMSSAQDGWSFPNQTVDVPTQLSDGVRGLMLDVHDLDGVPTLCHGYCALGSQPLVDGLTEIGAFLAANPSEVVTLILENYVDSAAIEQAMVDSQVDRWLVEHSADQAWPTLGALADADTRLVVFTDSGGGAFPGFLDQWEQAWQNPYAYELGDTFSCEVERGDQDGVFILNHFYTDPIADLALAEQANTADSLGEHTGRCADEGSFPAFVTVDFYDTGDVFTVVDDLNGG
jgi:hypothetical protein